MLGLQCRNFASLRSATSAVSQIPPGSSVMIGGFGCIGQPHRLCEELSKSGPTDLHVICESVGAEGYGAGQLFDAGLVQKVTCSFLGRNALVKQLYVEGNLEVEFVPQGTLVERIRAGGAGIPMFYCRAGAETLYESTGYPVKYSRDKVHVDKLSMKKETRQIDGVFYCLEHALKADFALLKAWKADKMGNVVFKDNTVNFNKVMATASRVKTIVEVEEIVECGEIDPNSVVIPSIYVDEVVKVDRYKTKIEKGTLHLRGDAASSPGFEMDFRKASARTRIAIRAAQELKPGQYVNLGVGIPCEAPAFCPHLEEVVLHGENGMLGLGPFPETEDDADADISNAARAPIKRLPHSSFFASEDAFAMIRGGHLSQTLLGALQVASNGDLASWLRPGQPTTGMGGAMELVTSDLRVVVTMQHTDKHGNPKIVRSCTLPLTGHACVDRIITEKAVFDVDRGAQLAPLILMEIAPDVTIEDLRAITDAPFVVSNALKPIDYHSMNANPQ